MSSFKRKRPYAARRRVRRRRTGRFRRRFRYRTVVPRHLGLGNKHIARLRYVTEIAVNATAGATAAHVFRANDLYDPDLTGIGHQPMGFDELMQFYDHFTVVGSKMKAQMIDMGSSVTPLPYTGIALSDSGTRTVGAANVNSLLEQWGTGRVVQAGRIFGPIMHNHQNVSYRKFSAKKFFQVKTIVGESQYRGDVSGGPTEQAYFELFCASAAGADPSVVNFLVTIDYLAVFTEPKPIAGS